MCRPTVTQRLQTPAAGNNSMWADLSFKPMSFEQMQQTDMQAPSPPVAYTLEKQQYVPEQFVPQQFQPQLPVSQASFDLVDEPQATPEFFSVEDNTGGESESLPLDMNFSDILFDDSELLPELEENNVVVESNERKRKFVADDGYSSAEDLFTNIDPLPFDTYQGYSDVSDRLSDSEADEDYLPSPSPTKIEQIPEATPVKLEPQQIIEEPKPVFDDDVKPLLRPGANKPAKIGKDGEEVVRSRFKGVRWYKRTSKWVVQIRINGTRKHIGYYANEEDAGKAYTLAMKGAKDEKAAKSNARKKSRKA